MTTDASQHLAGRDARRSPCGSPSEDDEARRAFVERFVESMTLGTDFHVAYLEPGREDSTREARANMTSKVRDRGRGQGRFRMRPLRAERVLPTVY